MATKQIIDKFVASVDVSTSYSVPDLVKLLKDAYKTTKPDKNNVDRVKKAPSKYNLFIKEQMAILKDDGCNPTERMKKATEKWKSLKEKNLEAASEAAASEATSEAASDDVSEKQ
jgi:hypothetical protein